FVQRHPPRLERVLVRLALGRPAVRRPRQEQRPHPRRGPRRRVLDLQHPFQHRLDGALLERLAHGRLGERLAGLGPPGGQVPQLLMLRLAHHQEAVAVAHDDEGEEPRRDRFAGHDALRSTKRNTEEAGRPASSVSYVAAARTFYFVPPNVTAAAVSVLFSVSSTRAVRPLVILAAPGPTASKVS